jgi:hypothetical protein
LSEWTPLAQSGLAVVWQARQWSLNRQVAVKVYRGDLSEDDRRRFLREAGAAGQLSGHRGVVTAHGAGILPDRRPYLIMELCPGGALTQWLHPNGPLTVERVRQIGVRIADALAAMHACGVLHRDVKPGNILIDSFGNPRLADFSLAAVVGAGGGVAEALCVTPAYAPPEGFAGWPATEAGDVYSLAATLYAVLVGTPPPRLAAVVTVGPEAEVTAGLLCHSGGVGEHLRGLLMAALSPDPAARPTAAGFRDQLANLPALGSSTRAALGAVEIGSARGADSLAVAGSAAAPQGGPGRRAAMLSLAAAVVTVVAATTVSVIPDRGAPSASPGEPSSSARPSQVPENGQSTPRTRPRADRDADPGSTQAETISVSGLADSARPYQTVPISGTYRGSSKAFLHVQRWEQGKWRAFPLPAKTDQSGQFTAYVELGQPSRYRLRVLHPDSGRTSEPFVLVIRG